MPSNQEKVLDYLKKQLEGLKIEKNKSTKKKLHNKSSQNHIAIYQKKLGRTEKKVLEKTTSIPRIQIEQISQYKNYLKLSKGKKSQNKQTAKKRAEHNTNYFLIVFEKKKKKIEQNLLR